MIYSVSAKPLQAFNKPASNAQQVTQPKSYSPATQPGKTVKFGEGASTAVDLVQLWPFAGMAATYFIGKVRGKRKVKKQIAKGKITLPSVHSSSVPTLLVEDIAGAFRLPFIDIKKKRELVVQLSKLKGEPEAMVRAYLEALEAALKAKDSTMQKLATAGFNAYRTHIDDTPRALAKAVLATYNKNKKQAEYEAAVQALIDYFNPPAAPTAVIPPAQP